VTRPDGTDIGWSLSLTTSPGSMLVTACVEITDDRGTDEVFERSVNATDCHKSFFQFLCQRDVNTVRRTTATVAIPNFYCASNQGSLPVRRWKDYAHLISKIFYSILILSICEKPVLIFVAKNKKHFCNENVWSKNATPFIAASSSASFAVRYLSFLWRKSQSIHWHQSPLRLAYLSESSLNIFPALASRNIFWVSLPSVNGLPLRRSSSFFKTASIGLFGSAFCGSSRIVTLTRLPCNSEAWVITSSQAPS